MYFRVVFIECGNLYIKIGNLENKKLYIRLYREAIVITNFKNELRSSIHMRIKIPEITTFNKNKSSIISPSYRYATRIKFSSTSTKLFAEKILNTIVITNFKNELRSSIHMRIKIPEVLNLYGIIVIIVYVMI
jgi:hypothetical protein